MLAGMFGSVTPRVGAAGIVVVKPSALAGWSLGPESPPQPNGGGSFVSGPGAPPGGTGSVQFTVDATGSHLLGTTLYNGTRFDQLTLLEYSTYRTSGGVALAPSLQFNVDYNLADANTAWQGRLIFEPYLAGTVSTGAWQTWNALAGPASGFWWATGAPGNGLCPQANPCTRAEVLSNFPNIGIHATLGALLFKVGSGWSTGFTGNVDHLTVGLAGDNTVFDFEPEAACTTLCYVNTATGNDSFGGDTPGSAKKTIGAALASVSPGGTVVVAAGSYPEAVTITKSGVTLRGAGSAASPAANTVITGPVGSSSGVRLPNSGTTGVTIRDLRVQGFTGGGICSVGTGNNGLRIEGVAVVGNTAGVSCLGGVYINGPVSNITINNVLADSNSSRGIVIWNGFKQNITITNNTVTNNNCCGIELQDGTASGVTITGNTVTGNTDSGIAAVGLRAGAGPNLIANNTLTDNGRFGIEIKLPDGTGAESGDGSIVVRDNTVRRVTPIEVQRPSELRDLGGIVVIRRAFVVGNGNVDIPTGVVVKNNTVAGYQQSNPGSASEGFGIVVEGLNMRAEGNTVSGSDVGIQTQAGHQPYAPNSATDGNQADLADQFFGRGNSPVTCVLLAANTFSGNGTDARALNAGSPTVTNQDTAKTFCTLQSAIDDPTTLAGHTILAGPRAYAENVLVGKALTLRGANAGVNPNTGARGPESVISPAAGRGMVITASGVTVDGFGFSGIAGDAAVASGAAFGGDASGVTLLNNVIEASSGAAGIAVQTPNSGAVSGWTIRDNLLRNLAGPVAAVSLQQVSSTSLSGNVISGVERGILLDAVSSTTLTGNAVGGVTTGVLIENGGQATLSGNQLANSGAQAGQGIGLDIAAGASATLDASAAANQIDGFATGVRVAGALAMAGTTVSNGVQGLLVQSGAGAVTIGDSRFEGQSGDYITLSGYPTDIDGRAAFFAGVRGDALSPAQYAAAQAKITDKNDNPALGLVILAPQLDPTTTTPADVSATYSAADQTLTLSATVTGSSPVSGGVVTFTVRLGATVIGAPAVAPVSAGTASASYTLPGGTPAGAYTIEAVFAPAAGQLLSGSSGTATLTVNKADTTTTITSVAPLGATVGQSVTVSFSVAVVLPSVGTPTGTVTVSDGLTSCSAPVAVGSCALIFASAGTRVLTATYSGDANFNPSSSAGTPYEVIAANVTVFLPVVLRSGTPDLAISAFSLQPAKTSYAAGEPVLVSVTITNQGDGTAQPFWVDLYLNPSRPPALNLPWQNTCTQTPCFGVAWPVARSLAPGESITLTTAPGAFPPEYSSWAGWLPVGTTDIYVLADSWAPGSPTGASGDRSTANNQAHIAGLTVSGSNPPLLAGWRAPQERPRTLR
ncbi:MAG TPA: right-handed parallel beta-helix repeat-containing protein [Roseiflexaceae bacterium]|nr:right-handed parallel beta-helix repeat-containing protein [Roseiflexaceae bacterium]